MGKMEFFRNSLQEHSLLSELAVSENMARDTSEPMDGKAIILVLVFCELKKDG